MKRFIWFVGGAALAAMVLLARTPAAADPHMLPTPIVRVLTATPAPTATPLPTLPAQPAPVAAPISAAGGITLGWTGQVQCRDCAPFKARVVLHHYDPYTGGINCFDYDEREKYCYSPLSSLLHYKAFWGLAAACPMEWSLGTWVDVPGAGTWICMDRGGMILCDKDSGVCTVDILGSGTPPWDGKEFDAILWVPLDPPRPIETEEKTDERK